MREWKAFKLSDFIHINPKVALRSGVQYSFVEMKDLNEGQKYVLPSQEKKLKGGARFNDNDTLFARITPCLQNGKICQVMGLKDSNGFGSTEFLVFRGVEDISDSNFIYYLSRYDVVRKFAEQNMVGTSGRQRVSKEAFDKIKLQLPSLAEQKSIAEILSSLDDKIELNNKINQELESLAQLLFKSWFVDFEFPNENEEPYKSSGGEMVDSVMGEIPKGWEIVQLSKVLTVKYGKDHKHLNDGKFPLYGSGGIMRFVEKPLYEKDSILIPRKGTLTNLFYVVEPFWSVDTMFYTEIHNPIYGKYLFHTIKGLDIASMNVGSAVPSLTTKILNDLKVINPAEDILFQFDNLITPMYEILNHNLKENAQLGNLRDSLLPKLISGELQIKEN